MEAPETRYAKSGDVHIAYQVTGDGPVDLVWVPGFVSNVEYVWQDPYRARSYELLAEFCRLIRFDKRGAGLSDRIGNVPSLEERMDDVRAVLDAVGSQRAFVVGGADGGSLMALFAATHPSRTSGLVLYAAPPRYAWAPDFPWGQPPEEARQRIAEVEARWGTVELARDVLRLSAPSVADDEDYVRIWAAYQRFSASPGSAAHFRRMTLEIDIRHVLPAIRVPTLVLHRVGDRFVAPEMSRHVAERIPGARYVELPGDDHFPAVGDVEAFIAEIEKFVSEVAAEEPWDEQGPQRVLATVLFTDLVGSTAKAAELGDARWRELLQEHHARVRRLLARFQGREHDTAGDGFFASFDGPARAIRCACAIADTLRDLGLEVRAGLHTGECELLDEKVAGIAVSIGARVAAQAEPGEVLVSSTVKDLVAGSGLQFEERGAAELKGVPGEWRLYAVKA